MRAELKLGGNFVSNVGMAENTLTFSVDEGLPEAVSVFAIHCWKWLYSGCWELVLTDIQHQNFNMLYSDVFSSYKITLGPARFSNQPKLASEVSRQLQKNVFLALWCCFTQKI